MLQTSQREPEADAAAEPSTKVARPREAAPDFVLTEPLKLAQRAYAALLDAPQFQPDLAFAARRSQQALDRDGRNWLARWLAWQLYARNLEALVRIERIDARLAASALHLRTGLSVSGRPQSSTDERPAARALAPERVRRATA